MEEKPKEPDAGARNRAASQGPPPRAENVAETIGRSLHEVSGAVGNQLIGALAHVDLAQKFSASINAPLARQYLKGREIIARREKAGFAADNHSGLSGDEADAVHAYRQIHEDLPKRLPFVDRTALMREVERHIEARVGTASGESRLADASNLRPAPPKPLPPVREQVSRTGKSNQANDMAASHPPESPGRTRVNQSRSASPPPPHEPQSSELKRARSAEPNPEQKAIIETKTKGERRKDPERDLKTDSKPDQKMEPPADKKIDRKQESDNAGSPRSIPPPHRSMLEKYAEKPAEKYAEKTQSKLPLAAASSLRFVPLVTSRSFELLAAQPASRSGLIFDRDFRPSVLKSISNREPLWQQSRAAVSGADRPGHPAVLPAMSQSPLIVDKSNKEKSRRSGPAEHTDTRDSRPSQAIGRILSAKAFTKLAKTSSVQSISQTFSTGGVQSTGPTLAKEFYHRRPPLEAKAGPGAEVLQHQVDRREQSGSPDRKVGKKEATSDLSLRGEPRSEEISERQTAPDEHAHTRPVIHSDLPDNDNTGQDPSSSLPDSERVRPTRSFIVKDPGTDKQYITGAEFAFVAIMALTGAARARPGERAAELGLAQSRREYILVEGQPLSDELVDSEYKDRLDNVLAAGAELSSRRLQARDEKTLVKVTPKTQSDVCDAILARSARSSSPTKTLLRPQILVQADDDLLEIAQTLFQDSRLGHLIADLNAGVSEQIYEQNARIVKLSSRQRLTLPVYQDILQYSQRLLAIGEMPLITIVESTAIDRELLFDGLAPVIGLNSKNCDPLKGDG
ncbi:MAG: hypothetical protein KGS72_13980 [Cyanobacteria bacterium REEB67]|nr:hypothetical protein [Cyanobacteria bacterium REEB67]